MLLRIRVYFISDIQSERFNELQFFVFTEESQISKTQNAHSLNISHDVIVERRNQCYQIFELKTSVHEHPIHC